MFNRKKAEASFCRSAGYPVIKVSLPGEDKPFYMHISLSPYLKELGERDLNDVIVALIKQKACMISEHNYPPVYEEMLVKSIKIQNERITTYGKSKEKEDGKGNKTKIKKGTIIKVIDIKPLIGVFVAQKYVNARRINDTGIVTGTVPGHRGELFSVVHSDDSFAVYHCDEIKKVESYERKRKKRDNR